MNYCLKTSLKNEQIFPGSLNPLLYVRSFQTTWTCLFELTWYPFGTQRCTIEMYTFHENIDILPETIKYSGKLFDSLMRSQLNPSLNVSCKVLWSLPSTLWLMSNIASFTIWMRNTKELLSSFFLKNLSLATSSHKSYLQLCSSLSGNY